MLISRRNVILGLAASTTCWPAPAVAEGHLISGRAFGSSWRLTVENTRQMKPAKAPIEKIIALVDNLMSPYKSTSALSQFNASHTIDWQTMPASVCSVASSALHISQQTNGAFDPTVGPLVSRFGFGPIEGGTGCYKDVLVEPNSIKKNTPDLTLDLCGIAKGYALDLVASELVRLNFRNAIIEIGGEIITIGKHPSGRPWQVGIANPLPDQGALYAILEPRSLALATSGHSANGLSGSISTSHIVNPSLGSPASTTLASVSVLAATAIEADAYATALCAAGTDDGVELATRLGISALFITDGTTAATEIVTGNFDAHIVS